MTAPVPTTATLSVAQLVPKIFWDDQVAAATIRQVFFHVTYIKSVELYFFSNLNDANLEKVCIALTFQL